MSKEYPKLLNGNMVRATLNGHKTQTRTPINSMWANLKMHHDNGTQCRLWVRETFVCGYDLDKNGNKVCTDAEGNDLPLKVWYGATDTIQWTDDDGWACNTPWKPSIHMPRWACRLILDVTEARIQRLQDISEEDALAEGIIRLPASGRMVETKGAQYFGKTWFSARDWYRDLWDSIYGKDPKLCWDANPEVVALSFNVNVAGR